MGILHSFFSKRTSPKSVTRLQKFVRLSTAYDKNTCPMCSQFEGKLFSASAAPTLPLCPTCRCAYEEYLEDSLPCGISRIEDFVLPASCTAELSQNHEQIYLETDIKKKIALCETGLKLLPAFMRPYLSAGFSAPEELACRDLAPELYMRLGDWENALRVIQFCISANAYYPETGEEKLQYLRQYSETAEITVKYIGDHPGLAQRDIYKKLCPPADREMLKEFIKSSLQIRKEPTQNTNRLYGYM